MSINLTYNKKQIAHSFSQAASTYDEVAFLQRAAGQCLLNKLIKLKNFKQAFKVILDLGSGTGQLTHQLAQCFPKSKTIAIDIAIGMLKFSQLNFPEHNIHRACADVDQLPLKNDCCDLVFSNLMLQWSPDYQRSLKEIWRVLKPNGILLFSTLGPDTLKELRYCWKKIDAYPHVHSFTPIKNLTQAISKNRFSSVSIEIKYYYRYFFKAIDLMKELKMLGASNMQSGRTKSLLSNKKLHGVFEAYEKFRDKKDMLPATYEIYFILATKAP